MPVAYTATHAGEFGGKKKPFLWSSVCGFAVGLCPQTLSFMWPCYDNE